MLRVNCAYIFIQKFKFLCKPETFIGCTPYSAATSTDLVTEIRCSLYPLRLRTKVFKIIPYTLRLRTKLLKSTPVHYVYAPLFSDVSRSRIKKPDFYLYPYSVSVPVPNANQDLKRCFFEKYLDCVFVLNFKKIVSSWEDFFRFLLFGVRFLIHAYCISIFFSFLYSRYIFRSMFKLYRCLYICSFPSCGRPYSRTRTALLKLIRVC